jgi:hypothetical protein
MKYDTRLDTFKFVSLYTLHLRLQQMDIEFNVWNATCYLKNSILWNTTPCSPLQAVIATCFRAGFLLGLFDPENGGDMFLRNVGWLRYPGSPYCVDKNKNVIRPTIVTVDAQH